ncbi:drug resistance transporter, EmrB/QacA subfamily [Dehalogenimonas lykanthroporepellens BL-DC-9]|jgi:EmrB/QacA subfamily drug resistance transporter|nr:drug resistance transporter, EmrB/QacA subfamily [Dehalogenimonas lykanthroporepellens BL-DC-9]
MQDAESADKNPRPVNKWAVLAVLSTALFMVNLDVTIVNIALPKIMDRLPASLSEAEWVLNAYVLVFAVLLVTLGRMGDIFGRKRLFIGGLAVFTVASFACGIAPNIGWLISGRVVQAIGGAAMMPATLSIINVCFQSGQRGLAMGIWGASAGAAAALGPIIGGLLVGSLGWPWVFLVNIPIGLIAFVAALKIVPESSDPNASRSLDWPGMATATLTLGALSFALIEGQAFGWTSPPILALFAVALMSAGTFLLVESRAPVPLVPISFFRNISFTAGNVLGLIVMFSLVGLIFLSVMYLQAVRDYSPMESGLIILPLPLAMMIVSPLAGRLADRLQMRFLLSAGMVMVGLGMSFLSQIQPDTPGWSMSWPLGLTGIGLGLVMAPLSSIVMASAPVVRSGTASGILTTMRQTGATLGITVLGAVLQFNMVKNLREFFDRIPFMPQSAKDAILEGVSHHGMGGAVTSDAPEYLQLLIGQVMTEQFTRATTTAIEVAMWVSLAGAAIALAISYDPKRTTGA